MNTLRSLRLCIVLLVAASAARAGDVHVDATTGADANDGSSWALAVRTISRAMVIANQVAGDDRVLVAAGTYAENVTLDQQNLQLLGGYPSGGGTRDPAANVTIIDGGATAPALTVSKSGGNQVIGGVVVDGFTFRNGKQLGRASIFGGGAGMFVEEAQVRITNNVFTSNVIDGDGLLGAGLYLFRKDAAASTISSNLFESNEARNGDGGALAIVDDGDPATAASIDVTGNTIRNNRAVTLAGRDPNAPAALGGGMYLWKGRPRVTNNVIQSNVAEDQGNVRYSAQGAGLFIVDSGPIVTGNTISSNVARALGGAFGGSGGGLYAWWSNQATAGSPVMTLDDNVFDGNRALGGTGANQAAGGGATIVVLAEVQPSVGANAFTNNQALGGGNGSAEGGGLFTYVLESSSGGLTIDGSTFTNNAAESGGGGAWLQGGAAGRVVVTNARVEGNQADFGSGLMLFGDGVTRHAMVRGNRVYDPDGDQVSEIADNCPGLANGVQSDADGDGMGDACDDDDDGDGTPDASDACPLVRGASCAGDQDGDGVGDGTDNCPQVANPTQADATLDGVGDACEPAAFDALETNAGGIWVYGDPTIDDAEIVENVGQGMLIVGAAADATAGTPEDPSSPTITNVTISANEAAGFITYLADGTLIRDSIIARNVLSDGFDTERPGGLPSSPNVTCNDVYYWDGVASLPCTGTGNMDFTNGDTAFTAGPFGNYYLGQTAAGQSRQFVGVDAGSRQASSTSVSSRTTRTDAVTDSGRVDLGFHYPTSMATTTPDALAGAVRVTKSASGASLSLSGVSPSVTAARWYRGSIPQLRAGQYSHQTPFTGLPGTPECSAAPAASVSDPNAIGDGNAYYYLAVPLDGTTEGSFGTDSFRIARPAPADSATDLVINGCP